MKNLLLLITLTVSFASHAKTLTIYAYATESLIRPIFEQYTQQTGVKINYVIEKGPVLIERLKAEGSKTPADLLMVVDAGNLWLAAQSDLLAQVKSKSIDKNIPAYLRDPQNKWIGISQRARTIFYNPTKVKPEELESYEDLASDKWNKRLCLRTSNNVYNQSLVASFIENMGTEKAESILKGWISNLAAPVFSSDTLLLKAIDSGQCDIGIANTYYYGRLVAENPNFKAKIFWPNQKNKGVHVNVRGIAIVAHSKQKKLAQNFLEWTTEPAAQKLLAEMNYEFPIHSKAELHPIVSNFGSFKANPMPLHKAGENQRAAVQLMDRVGYK